MKSSLLLVSLEIGRVVGFFCHSTEKCQLLIFQSLSPEVTIFLYDDEQKLVHMKLIEMGLADLEE